MFRAILVAALAYLIHLSPVVATERPSDNNLGPDQAAEPASHYVIARETYSTSIGVGGDEPATDRARISARNSLVAMAVCRLVEAGRIPSLDTAVYHYIPALALGKKSDVTIRMLINHTSGLQTPETLREMIPADRAQDLALSSRLHARPGSSFAYYPVAFTLLSMIVEEVSSESATSYISRGLLAPMEIGPIDDRFALTEMDTVKVAMLVLNNGYWRGEQLVSKHLLRELATQGEFTDEVGLFAIAPPRILAFSIDQSTHKELRRLGTSEQMVVALAPYEGLGFADEESLKMVLRAAWGSAEFKKWWEDSLIKGVSLGDTFRARYAGMPFYSFEGMTGHRIVVRPDEGIVAVHAGDGSSGEDGI